MHDGKKHPLQVMREAAAALVETQWVDIPDVTFADEEDEEDSNRVNRLVFFPVPKEADACRVEVTFRVYPPARMAWLRNAWDAYHAKSTRGKTARRIDDSRLTRVFDWLLPGPEATAFQNRHGAGESGGPFDDGHGAGHCPGCVVDLGMSWGNSNGDLR